MDVQAWVVMKNSVYQWINNHPDHDTVIKKFASWLGVLKAFEVLYWTNYKAGSIINVEADKFSRFELRIIPMFIFSISATYERSYAHGRSS